MQLLVKDRTIDGNYNFYIISNDSNLIDWHYKTFGHYYKTLTEQGEITKLVEQYDFADDSFEVESKKIIKEHGAVLVTSASESADYFQYAISCHQVNEAPSEFNFIVGDCMMLSGTEVDERKVYNLNDVIDSYNISSLDNNLAIKNSVFGTELYNFLKKNEAFPINSDLYKRPNLNDNPHKSAILATFLFKNNFTGANLEIMDYWNSLAPEDKKYCGVIVNKMSGVRDEWNEELCKIEEFNSTEDIPYF